MDKRNISSVPADEFRRIVEESFSYKEALVKIGVEPRGGNYITLKKRIVSESLDDSRIKNGRKWIHNNRPKIPLDDILVENSTYTNMTKLKKQLIKEGVLEERCGKCGVGSVWNGLPLVIQMDHINGKRNDNRVENLRMLCPNCHSQTKTYSGKKTTGTRAVKKYCSKCECEVGKRSKTGMCKMCYLSSRKKK